MSYNSNLKRSDEHYVGRIRVLQEMLKTSSWQAWLIENPLDLYYLLGKPFSKGQLWICKDEVFFFVDKRYTESAKTICFVQSLLYAEDAVEKFLKKQKFSSVAFDSEKTVFSRAAYWKGKAPSIIWEPIASITRDMRMKKDAEEILLIKESAKILWKGYLYIKTLLQEGVREKDIAKAFTIFCLQEGADGLSFEPIIAFGENSALPHYRAGNRVLSKGDVVLIDIGVIYQGYASDMTRTVFFGSPDPLLFSWFDFVLEAEQEAIRLCQIGTPTQELDRVVREIFKKHRVEKYFLHSLGHGVGLEVHESPLLRFDHEGGTIAEGMVLAIEPGLYLPGKGGVRYEDMVIVTDAGSENLFPLEKAVL